MSTVLYEDLCMALLILVLFLILFLFLLGEHWVLRTVTLAVAAGFVWLLQSELMDSLFT